MVGWIGRTTSLWRNRDSHAMIYTQNYQPLSSAVLSTLVAALPVLVLFYLLVPRRVLGPWAASGGAVTALRDAAADAAERHEPGRSEAEPHGRQPVAVPLLHHPALAGALHVRMAGNAGGAPGHRRGGRLLRALPVCVRALRCFLSDRHRRRP